MRCVQSSNITMYLEGTDSSFIGEALKALRAVERVRGQKSKVNLQCRRWLLAMAMAYFVETLRRLNDAQSFLDINYTTSRTSTIS